MTKFLVFHIFFWDRLPYIVKISAFSQSQISFSVTAYLIRKILPVVKSIQVTEARRAGVRVRVYHI